MTTSSCAWLPLPCLAVLQCQRKPEPFPYGLCLESSCFIECSSRGFRVRLEKWTRIAGFCLLNGFVHFEVQCSFVVQFKRGCSRSSAWHLRALLCSAASISLLFTRAQENGSLLWQAALFHCCYLLPQEFRVSRSFSGVFFFTNNGSHWLFTCRSMLEIFVVLYNIVVGRRAELLHSHMRSHSNLFHC